MKKIFISTIIVLSMFMGTLSVFADGIKVTRDVEKEKFTVSGMVEENSVVKVKNGNTGDFYFDFRGSAAGLARH